jgi:peptidylprolyl isomerase
MGFLAQRMAPLAAACTIALAVPSAQAAQPAARTMQQVLEASTASDWRRPDPADTLYMDLPGGRVVIELATAYAPLHAANLRTFVRAHYFDGLAVLRVQDGFVTQWGDPAAGEKGKARPFGKAAATLAPEFERAIAADLPFTRLADGDVYASEVGFSSGFPVARDAAAGKTWLAHCYGMVGAGRDTGVETGSGAELYVVIGQAPRQLDRNIALVGRVLQGMELLSSLPRGSGALGFYEDPAQQLPIRSVRLAADLPASERLPIEVLRTDTDTFAALVESRRNRRDDWYKVPAGRIDLCNVPIPVRLGAASDSQAKADAKAKAKD